MDPLRHRHKVLFTVFIAINLLLLGSAVAVFFFDWEMMTQMTAFFLALFVLAAIDLWFQPRLQSYAYQNSVGRLRRGSTVEPPSADDLSSPLWVAHLKSLGFAVAVDVGAFAILHRVSKNPNRTIVPSKVHDVIVYVRRLETSYHDPAIQAEVNRLESSMAARKIRVRDSAIVVVKSGAGIDGAIDAALGQVVFEKQSEHGIVVMPSYYDRNSHRIHYLHASDYAPTALYGYAIDMFKATYETFRLPADDKASKADGK
ncbi:MAG: hypothetical protein WC509_00900 [Candidatus Izemoplasmatales bacterium]